MKIVQVGSKRPNHRVFKVGVHVHVCIYNQLSYLFMAMRLAVLNFSRMDS
jgi:hypothetical protein